MLFRSLVEIGEWLRPNGEAIYGTTAFNRPAQWSSGQIPRLEQKEFRAEYDITKMVDDPPAGYARIEAFFTRKDPHVYAILPRWPGGDLILRDIPVAADCKVTMLGAQGSLRCKQQGDGVAITIPIELRANTPPSQAYVLKLAGIKS